MRGHAGSGSHRVLAGATSRPLAGDDGALDEELASPNAPRLLTLEGAGEALEPRGAEAAEGLGELHVLGSLGEPELRVVVATRDGLAELLRLSSEVEHLAEWHRHLLLRGPRHEGHLFTRSWLGPQAGAGGAGLGPAARHARSHVLSLICLAPVGALALLLVGLR